MTRIGERARKQPNLVFTSLYHCVTDLDVLRVEVQRRGQKSKQFAFLGFRHYCGKTRRGNFRLKRRASRKKLAHSLRQFTEWARKSRSVLRKGRMLRKAKIRIDGHLNYYAITDNLLMCSTHRHHATRILFKWLNRKSQRSAYT